MQTATHTVDQDSVQEQRRYYRIERQFSSQRRIKDLVRDLLRAHNTKERGSALWPGQSETHHP